jgi:hypothetical protein
MIRAVFLTPKSLPIYFSKKIASFYNPKTFEDPAQEGEEIKL